MVAEHDLKDLPEPLAKRATLDGHRCLDAGQKIAVHPVGGADVEFAVHIVGCGVAGSRKSASARETGR